MAALIAELQPDVVGVEARSSFQVNVPATAVSVGQASGLALARAAAAGCGGAVHPNQVEEAVTG